MVSIDETDRGQRFAFGQNWRNFLETVDDERIYIAEQSLREMLGVGNLEGKHFLDVGSGSGLFSLAARRLGAVVHSFDFDPASVACTRQLRDLYSPGDSRWVVEHGDVLDELYLSALGLYDVVYSWGVLHHTGDMWAALRLVAPLVAPGGNLFVALYNDQGGASRRWRIVKKAYNSSPPVGKLMLTLAVGTFWEFRTALTRMIRRQNPLPFRRWREKKQSRGMSNWYDLVDWVGGYPFEVARPDDVFDFFHSRGFNLRRLVTCQGGHGCNQYVFERHPL